MAARFAGGRYWQAGCAVSRAANIVPFQAVVDDLNSFQVAELSLDDMLFALMRHDGTADDETELSLPDSVPSDRVGAAVERILTALDLSTDALSWIRPPDRSKATCKQAPSTVMALVNREGHSSGPRQLLSGWAGHQPHIRR
jgi:hypothetical protein